jgi:hypothetical protein
MSSFKNIKFGVVRVRNDSEKRKETLNSQVEARIKEYIINAEIPSGANIRIPLWDLLPRTMNKFPDSIIKKIKKG